MQPVRNVYNPASVTLSALSAASGLTAGPLPIKTDHHSDRQHYWQKHVRKWDARGIRQRAVQKIGTECCTERDQYYS